MIINKGVLLSSITICLLAWGDTRTPCVVAFAPPQKSGSLKTLRVLKSSGYRKNWHHDDVIDQKKSRWHLFAKRSNKNREGDGSQPHNHQNKRQSRFQIRRRLRNLFRNPALWGFLTVLLGGVVSNGSILGAPPAEASAPVMAMPKAEDLDPGREALDRQEKMESKKAQMELDEFAQKGRQIEAQQGKAARAKYEQDYKARKAQQAAEKAAGFVKLKRELLDQGIDPWCDVEGQRQQLLYEKGIDMAEVSGTHFSIEKLFQEKSPKKSQKYLKEPHRGIIKLMVQDMKNRDLDPLEYFESHKEQTMALIDISRSQAEAMLARYTANMEQYGQITVPKPGEQSYKEKLAAIQADPAVQKKLAAEKKAAEKAEKKAEKERARAEAKAAKEEAKLAKAAAKEEAKAAAKAAAASAAAVAAVGTASTTTAAGASAGAAVLDSATAAAVVPSSPSSETVAAIEGSSSASEEVVVAEGGENDVEEEQVGSNSDDAVAALTTSAASTASTTTSNNNNKKKIDIVPVSVVVAGVGAGAYGINIYRKRAAEEEEERQRQFRLLMGGDGGDGSSGDTSKKAATDSVTAELDIMDLEDEPVRDASPPAPAPDKPEAAVSVPPPPPPPAAVPAKKRRLGIFKSKKDNRETNLKVLVSPGAQAPEFARLLGKILTFGAPGRFPSALSVLGSDMPMDTFDLDAAKNLLIEARQSSGLEVSQSAEIFANVVNCMLIDIVDLASSSLKEKESKVTVEAINIVVDFMNHAASLYEAVAEGVTITPVTYSGSLSKSKLEQMYSQYAVGAMMNMGADTGDDLEGSVALLQDVFSINEKKAQGLMLKAMQKNMMEMMKNGGEGMEDMMKNMGMDGLMGGGADGLGGGADAVDPEQLKTMLIELKNAKDNGEIGKQELDQVRQMFMQSFGTSIDDLVKNSEDATPEDKEVMELMKSVLG